MSSSCNPLPPRALLSCEALDLDRMAMEAFTFSIRRPSRRQGVRPSMAGWRKCEPRRTEELTSIHMHVALRARNFPGVFLHK